MRTKSRRRGTLTLDVDRLMEKGPELAPAIMQKAAEMGYPIPQWLGLLGMLAPMASQFLLREDEDGWTGPDVGPIGSGLASYWRERERWTDADVTEALAMADAAVRDKVIPDVMSSFRATMRLVGGPEREAFDRIVGDVGAPDSARRVADVVYYIMTHWTEKRDGDETPGQS